MFSFRNTIRELAHKFLQKTGVLINQQKSIVTGKFEAHFWGEIPYNHRSASIESLGAVRVGNTMMQKVKVYHEEWNLANSLCSSMQDFIYTANGFAIKGGQIDLSASARVPIIRELGSLVRGTFSEVIEQGTIIQSQHPFTYGDWCTEVMLCLAKNRNEISGPVLLPSTYKGASYVQRELEAVGVDFRILEHDVYVSNAVVLHKQNPRNYWSVKDVEDYQSFLGLERPLPEEKTILYLSRSGIASQQLAVARVYPSEYVQEIVARHSGRTVMTRLMAAEDYNRCAPLVDIVVADHGAAIFNIVRWAPSVLIEIVDENWWSNCFVFLSKACGVKHHFVVSTYQKDPEEISEEINQVLTLCKTL